MEFELKRAGEKLEKEQKDRKEKATKMIEKEKKAKQEAAIRREAIEAAQRSRRIHAIESHQHKVNVNPVKDEPVASAANNSAPTASSSKAAVPPSTRPITENEVRAFLLHKAPIPPRDFVSHFKPRVQNKEDKQAFADILRRISKIQKANGHSHVILRGHPLLTTFSNTQEKKAKWVFDKRKGKPLKPLPDFLREYNLPPGLFPQNITCYEFDETKLMLVVPLPAPCEVCFKDQSVIRYATRVKGLVSRGKFTVIEGMKTKIVVWLEVTSVVVENYRSDKVWFMVGVNKSRPRDAYETPRDAIRVDDF